MNPEIEHIGRDLTQWYLPVENQLNNDIPASPYPVHSSAIGMASQGEKRTSPHKD